MNIELFMKVLDESRIEYNTDLYIRARYGNGSYHGPCLYERWDISRKNAYDPESSESEPEFVTLDKTLALLAPSITYLHYKELGRAMIRRETYDDSDYYNTIERGIKYIKLEELLDFLSNKGYLHL